jgi:hypothetical protein
MNPSVRCAGREGDGRDELGDAEGALAERSADPARQKRRRRYGAVPGGKGLAYLAKSAGGRALAGHARDVELRLDSFATCAEVLSDERECQPPRGVLRAVAWYARHAIRVQRE